MTEKLIATGEIFFSWSEFQDALKAFSEQTFQVFNIDDSKRLKPKVNPDSQLKSTECNITEKFKYINELSPEVDYFILENRSIQLQKGSNDCGLFSLANLRSLCQEADPSLLHYEQKLMRNHFNVCIENKTFNSFKYRVTSRKNITHKSKIFNCKTNKFE